MNITTLFNSILKAYRMQLVDLRAAVLPSFPSRRVSSQHNCAHYINYTVVLVHVLEPLCSPRVLVQASAYCSIYLFRSLHLTLVCVRIHHHYTA